MTWYASLMVMMKYRSDLTPTNSLIWLPNVSIMAKNDTESKVGPINLAIRGLHLDDPALPEVISSCQFMCNAERNIVKFRPCQTRYIVHGAEYDATGSIHHWCKLWRYVHVDNCLTHYGLVMPYGDTELGQLWIGYRLVACRHQDIHWNDSVNKTIHS